MHISSSVKSYSPTLTDADPDPSPFYFLFFNSGHALWCPSNSLVSFLPPPTSPLEHSLIAYIFSIFRLFTETFPNAWSFLPCPMSWTIFSNWLKSHFHLWCRLWELDFSLPLVYDAMMVPWPWKSFQHGSISNFSLEQNKWRPQSDRGFYRRTMEAKTNRITEARSYNFFFFVFRLTRKIKYYVFSTQIQHK